MKNGHAHHAESRIAISLTRLDLIRMVEEHYNQVKEAATESVYCRNCGPSQMGKGDFELWVNHLGDVIWDGRCVSCRGPVTRYLEVGENPEIHERAMQIRKLKMEVLDEYEIRPE